MFCLLALTALIALLLLATPSPAEALRTPVPFTEVKLTDDFWRPRQGTNRTVTIPHAFRECEDTGRIRNFEIAGKLAEGQFEGIYFNDSDVYKMLEGIAYDLALHPDPALDRRTDELIAKIAAAQQPDGYLNTYFTLVEPQNRWTNLPVMHELYCSGHLFEAAVAHYQATGKRNLLEVAVRLADHIDRTFGDDRLVGVPGHEEIELALVKLAEATGEERYFRLAQWFIDRRGSSDREYCQDHMPVREQSELVGHAVRAMYLYAGMADVATRTGDAGLIAALGRLWEDLTRRRLYLTGGVGPSAHNEGFTTAYDLPNESAYAETCAAIGLVLWSQRMFLLHGRSEYVDTLERALYNGVISGVSLTGDRFFYVNPLAARGGHHRQPWFGCACCPPNVMRLLPQIGGMVYATSVGGSRAAPATPAVLYVNLYLQSEATVHVGGRPVEVTQKTNYPWSGEVKLTISPDAPTAFDLRLRVPDWCEAATVKVDGDRTDAPPEEDGYLSLSRTWQPGDTVTLKLDMPVRRIAAHPRVAADAGRVALMRGPLVYCLEGVDNEGAVFDLALPRHSELKPEWRPDLLGGVMTLHGKALRRGQWESEALYRPVSDETLIEVTAIPYYAWDHREAGEMAVWLPETTALAEAKLPPTLAQQAEVNASHVNPPDSLRAANDRVEPKSSADLAVPRFTWWDHQGTEEWIAYAFREPRRARCVEVYWFDDTGVGECRAPASWRIETLQGGDWREVQGASAYGVAKDALNRVTFEPVETTGVRLVVRLQDGFSGGLLEWRLPDGDSR